MRVAPEIAPTGGVFRCRRDCLRGARRRQLMGGDPQPGVWQRERRTHENVPVRRMHNSPHPVQTIDCEAA